jgi:release factor glutamine methyltransferase
MNVVDALRLAGCVAAEAEAVELVAVAQRTGAAVADLVARRVTGEPLAWITGQTTFCGRTIAVHPGVYVPRPQTEALALAARAALPAGGLAVDLCTGSGAVAAVVGAQYATDLDSVAVECARSNGVDAVVGDLDQPLPAELRGEVDVLTSVPPYVPADRLHLLPRDTLAFEPRLALDGGIAGLELLARVAMAARWWLRPGGHLLVELGGDQVDLLGEYLVGMDVVDLLRDAEGDVRTLVAARSRPRA